MAWDYIPTTLLLLTIVSRSSGTGYIMSELFSLASLSSFVRNINHRLRGYSNPDDVMDFHSRHFHHYYGGVESFPSNPSPENRFHNESFCNRFCSFFSFSKGTSSEIEGDSQTRLVVSSRQPRDQRQPPQGKIPDDPFFHRFDLPIVEDLRFHLGIK